MTERIVRRARSGLLPKIALLVSNPMGLMGGRGGGTTANQGLAAGGAVEACYR